MIVGKLVWLQEEVRKEDISIVLMIQEQFSTSVLFKDILEAISLILHYRTMWWLGLEYSITFSTLDAHSIFILLSTMHWYLEVKIWAEDRQYSSCPLIQERRKSQISWTYWLLCTTSSAIRAQCMEEAPRRGILGWFWSCDQRRINIQTRSNAIILQGTLPAYCIQNVEKLKTGEVVWKRIFVSSTTTKDLIETRSRLD